MSLFSKINDIDTGNFNINNDLAAIRRWACQWKMFFNPDINKPATEVYFLKDVKNLWLHRIFSTTTMYWVPPAKNTWVFSWIASLVSVSMLPKKINECNRIIRLTKKLSFNTIKETIAWNNLENICKISFGLCRLNLCKLFNDSL